jgi:hypothetical protein
MRKPVPPIPGGLGCVQALKSAFLSRSFFHSLKKACRVGEHALGACRRQEGDGCRSTSSCQRPFSIAVAADDLVATLGLGLVEPGVGDQLDVGVLLEPSRWRCVVVGRILFQAVDLIICRFSA